MSIATLCAINQLLRDERRGIMMNRCLLGDCRDSMRQLIAEGVRVQTVVTSPPYWGLRDYGVDGQLGLEATITEYVANMVDVFRPVRDLLADNGTLWINLGDSFSNGAQQNGLKPKDLCGIPWAVAFALRADGWYLRSDIIWHKPNPMPESIIDRPTKSHEYLFLLSKREKYYYDQNAIREPSSEGTNPRRAGNGYKTPDGWDTSKGKGGHGSFHKTGREAGYTGYESKRKLADPGSGTKNNDSFDAAMAIMPSTRNKRTVWTIATESFSEAHFATFPQALVEPCILAGSRVGDIVFDPFMGSGTVAQVAQNLGRQWIGCELNPAYIEMQRKRTAQQGLVLV